MAVRATEQVGRALVEQTLALRGRGLSAVVVPAPRAPLTVLPAAVREDVVSLWHRPDDRSFAGVGVAAAIELQGTGRWRQLREATASLLDRLDVIVHHDATAVRPVLVGGLSFAPGWTDDCWESFGDGGFVLHRWTYERAEHATLTLAVDASTLDDDAAAQLLAEYDRIVGALAAAASDELFPPPERDADGTPEPSLRQMPMVDWIDHVRSIQQELERGEFMKLVAARRCDVRVDGLGAMTIVSRMAHDFADCTTFLFQRGERTFVGATPEMLFSKRGRIVESQALAGSLQAQGGSGNREALLTHSRKNLGEHDVVVRAIVDGLAEHCVAIEHPPEPEIVHVRNLIHLSTPIRGELREGAHAVDLLETLHPTPAVGGVPRHESIRWIVEHERAPRGWYTGPIGWIDTVGDATFRVAIRCGVVEPGCRARLHGRGHRRRLESGSRVPRDVAEATAVASSARCRHMTEENLLTQWSRLLLSSLADAGVRDVVLSPGSRSTPFIVAAASEPRLRCHDSIDERAASFFALGQARVTGRPSLLICTSGTAAAHYLPAVMEASLSYVPLLVLTADRPLELQDCAAPQTVDQIKLMGDQVRRFYELGTPDAAPSALIGLRRLAAQAVHYTLWPTPGPVHLNARARKPLEPAAATSDAGEALEAHVDELLARPIVAATPPTVQPDAAAVERAAAICRGTERGLIVCGPGPLRQRRLRESVDRLARATGYPVLAESASQLRLGPDRDGVVRCDAFDAVLRSRSFRERHRPDVILQIGAAPVSGGYEQYGLAHTDVATIVVAPHGWQDPLSRATELILGDPLTALEQLERAIGATAPSRSEWSDTFDEADRRAWAVVDTDVANADEPFSEGAAVRTVLERVPSGSLLMLGNSLSVREVDTFCRPGSVDVDVLCQRGANGIDGIVSGASGSAAAQEQPVTVLLGDVSFLHDLTGLALAGGAGVPVVVIVVNNNGGRLFEQLPLARVSGLPPGVMEHVTTPHDARLEHAALLFGHRYGAAQSAPELAALIDEAYAAPGCTVVEAKVSAHGAAAQHARVFAGIAAAVDELAAPLATGSER